MLLRAIVAMVAGTSLLAAASPAGAGSLEDCGQRVIRDWYSGGRVDKVYPLPCYRAAIRALPDDVLQYTDASTTIERALESARQGTTENARTRPDDTPAPPPTSPPAATSKAPTPTTASRAAVHPPSAPPHDPTRLASGPAREPREPGVPYPLIALAALSLVLLASGIAAGLAHRRR